MVSSPSPPSAAAAPPPPPPPPPLPTPPPSAPKKGFIRRVFPLFLTASLGIAAYVLIKQSAEKDNEEKVQATSSPVPKTESAVPEKELAAEPFPAPVKVLPPIPEHEQRQLFKWILEEKRKVKPSDPTEKKKLDEEKALLKQFIRAKSVPSI